MTLRSPNRNRRRNQRKGINPTWSLSILGGALLVIGIWIGISLENREKLPESSNDTPQVFTLATMEVARQFACPCGSCGEKVLAVCECPTAISTKRFIETQFNNGYSNERVVELVKEVYGHHRG